MAESSTIKTKPNFKEIAFEEIEYRLLLGRGSFGTVYKAVWKDKYVAVKEFDVLADKKEIETEIKQLSRVEHKNIILLYGVSVTEKTTNLIMEYAEGGSLYNLLHGPNQAKYTAAHAMSWSRQCAEGVAYMHGIKPQPLIHRDLKPPNLLLFDYGRCLKICDFGTVADKSTQMTNSKGSAAWMAPEVFATSNYTEKCDVFSWGIILWEVLTREIPFAKNTLTLSIMWRIHQGDRPDLNRFIGCPQPIEALMKQCWDPEPYKRPAMKQVVELMKSLCSHLPGADEPIDFNSDTTSNNESAYTIESSNDDNVSTISNNEPLYENLPNPLYTDTTNNTNSDSNSIDNNSTEYPSSIFVDLIGLQIESPNWLATNKIICDIKNSTDKQSNTTSDDHSQSSSHNSLKYNSNISQYHMQQYNTKSKYQENEQFPAINYLPTNMTENEILARNEEIRNEILNSQSLKSLSVEVDPNTWQLDEENISNFYSNLSKNDGKERLTITETKAVHNKDDDSTIRTSSIISSSHNINNNNCISGINNSDINNVGGGGGVSVSIIGGNQTNVDSDYGDSNTDDDTDESYHLMLDSELQPEAPDPNNKLSQKIFKEHKKLAKEYLQVDEQLYYANDEKQKLLDSMDPDERNRKLQFIKKMAEKKELAELQQYLQQQLEELQRMQTMEQQNHQQFLLQQHQQQLQQQYQRQPSSPSADLTDENGWVFISGDRGGQPGGDQL